MDKSTFCSLVSGIVSETIDGKTFDAVWPYHRASCVYVALRLCRILAFGTKADNHIFELVTGKDQLARCIYDGCNTDIAKGFDRYDDFKNPYGYLRHDIHGLSVEQAAEYVYDRVIKQLLPR